MNRLLWREIARILVSVERFLTNAEEKSNPVVLNPLEKQHLRFNFVFDRHIVSWRFQSKIGINGRLFFEMTNFKLLKSTVR